MKMSQLFEHRCKIELIQTLIITKERRHTKKRMAVLMTIGECLSTRDRIVRDR